MKSLIRRYNGEGAKDDIDHLGNRRVRSVGELVENQFRIGFLPRGESRPRTHEDLDLSDVLPSVLLNIRPVVAAVRSSSAAASSRQFMDQTNPLAELTHKRRLSALGPGGLSRERAGFEVRDVHHSHYGRICPIETPEGPNIGLIGSLATYGRDQRVRLPRDALPQVSTRRPQAEERSGRPAARMSYDRERGRRGARGCRVTTGCRRTLTTSEVKVPGPASPRDRYLAADEEERTHRPGQRDARRERQLHRARGPARRPTFREAPGADRLHGRLPKQIVCVATALIPFLEHDDANRALMGSNMQRQAVPLLQPEAPIVGTGMEAARRA